MPMYDYVCKKCGERFTLVMTINERTQKAIRCPKCEATEVEQQLQTFFAKTSRKS